MEMPQCPKCGGVVSKHEILLKQLIDEKNVLVNELKKLVESISLYTNNNNAPEVIFIKTLRNKKNEQITYIDNLIKNLHYQMKCEKFTYHELFINHLISELMTLGYSREHINHFKQMSLTEHGLRMKKVRKELQRIYKKSDNILCPNEWKNSSGYCDPTAKIAIDKLIPKKF